MFEVSAPGSGTWCHDVVLGQSQTGTGWSRSPPEAKRFPPSERIGIQLPASFKGGGYEVTFSESTG